MDQHQPMDHAARAFDEAMRQALARVDAAQNTLQQEREALAAERNAVADLHRQAEQEGEQRANAYFDERRAQLIAHTRYETILGLVVKHLRNGRPEAEVARWLDADADLMAHAARLVQRHRDDHALPRAPHNATLGYTTAGRGGTVHYRDDRTSFTMWWEFAMEPAVAIIGVPDPATWERATGIPLEERPSTLEWIAQRALHDQVSGGGLFRIAKDHITLYGA